MLILGIIKGKKKVFPVTLTNLNIPIVEIRSILSTVLFLPTKHHFEGPKQGQIKQNLNPYLIFEALDVSSLLHF
jgi:hypothetical protein